MVRYALATKISETDHIHNCEIYNDSKLPDCYAVIDGTNKIIKI